MDEVPSQIRLAIVGSTAFAKDVRATIWAMDEIRTRIRRLHPSLIISGGAEGIDEVAKQAAHAFGIPFREELPKNPRWEPDGYKARNTIIAGTCTHLLCIRHHASTTYGSGWTADQAEHNGAVVERLMYERR